LNHNSHILGILFFNRPSATLSRVCVEKLCRFIENDLKSRLDTIIGNLVAKGLDKNIEIQLDTARVIGNEAAHTGELLLEEDDKDLAIALLEIINEIATIFITRPKKNAERYELLPEDKRKGIEARNKKASEKSVL